MKTFEDNRGLILDFEDGVSIITSNKGAVRARHFHCITGHKVYLTKGSLEYYERHLDNKHLRPIKFTINAPALFETDRLLEHEMIFTAELSEMTCVRTGAPDHWTQQDYENDLVRFDYSLKDIYDNWKE